MGGFLGKQCSIFRCLALALAFHAGAQPMEARAARWEAMGPSGGDFVRVLCDPANAMQATAILRSPAGVYSSSNGGESWNKVGAIATSDLRDADAYSTSKFFAVSSSLLFSSPMGGAFWTQKSLPALAGSARLVRAHPTEAATALVFGVKTVGTGTTKRDSFAFLKTKDDGQTWNSSTFFEFNSFAPTDAAVAKSDPNVIYVCGLGERDGSQIGVLLKTSDGGANWTDLASLVDSSTTALPQCLAIDPSNAGHVYLGAEYFYSSADGGATWMRGARLDAEAIRVDAASPSKIYVAGGPSLHASADSGGSWQTYATGSRSAVADLAVSPADPSTLFLASASSLAKSTDSGATWGAAHEGIYAASVPALAVAPSDHLRVYIDKAGDSLMVSPDGAFSWNALPSLPAGGSVAALLVHPTSAQTALALASEGAPLYRSVNGGASWAVVSGALTRGGALAQTPGVTARVYAGGSAADGGGGEAMAVCKSTDGGATWGAPLLLGTAPGVCRALAVADANLLYAGGSAGGVPRVFRSLDGGGVWSDVTHNLGSLLLASDSIRSVWISPHDSSLVLVGATGGVFMTSNGGNDWTPTPLARPTNAFVYYQSNNILCAATDGFGVYRSDNLGASWSEMNDGLTALGALALGLDSRTGALFAGTRSGSVWRLDLGAPKIFQVFPSEGYSASGRVGGPFEPTSQTYTVRNASDFSVMWLATSSVNWLSLSSTGGILKPGAFEEVRVFPNDSAEDLGIENYEALIAFSAPDLGATEKRPVLFNVRPMFTVSSWKSMGPGPAHIAWSTTDPNNPLRVSAVTAVTKGFYHSLNGAATWERVADMYDSFANDVQFLPFGRVSAFDFMNLYSVSSTGSNIGWRRSTDGGVTWEQGTFPPDSGTAYQIAADPWDADRVYATGVSNATGGAGSSSFVFLISNDAGRTWSASRYFDLGSIQTRAIAVAHTTPRTLYVCGRRTVTYVSYGLLLKGVEQSDGSWVWTDMSANVYAETDIFSSVVIDPSDPNRLYVGGRNNIHSTSSGGANWHRDASE